MEECHAPCWNPNRNTKDTDVRQGTLALKVLKTLDVLGPLLQAEARSWEQTTAIMERFFAMKAQDMK